MENNYKNGATYYFKTRLATNEELKCSSRHEYENQGCEIITTIGYYAYINRGMVYIQKYLLDRAVLENQKLETQSRTNLESYQGTIKQLKQLLKLDNYETILTNEWSKIS